MIPQRGYRPAEKIMCLNNLADEDQFDPKSILV
jgi:hypothetical protein